MSFSLRIALADDDRAMRETLRRMLVELGHEVVAVAENGPSLIDQCASTQPDVVITSRLSPEMSGCDAAAVIYQRRPIPIILYSGDCEPDQVVHAEHKHVFLYLVQPICEEHLQAALKECCGGESEESSGVDEKAVPANVVSGSAGNAPYREHIRPPYRNLPR